MTPASSGLKLTYDDFVLFPDDGKRHELIDGEHYVTPSPNLKHQQVLGNLHLLIGVCRWPGSSASDKVLACTKAPQNRSTQAPCL